MSSRLGDGLWSTKFILPEHSEAMERQQLEEGRRQRPTLDAQELELIENALAESYRDHRRITVRVFGEYGDDEIAGIVTAVQTYRREVKLSTGPGEWQWVRIEDILGAE